jgi:hypothetical protein
VTSDPELTIPAGYAEILAQIKAEVLAGRARAARAVNGEVIKLYWRIGSSCWIVRARSSGAAAQSSD